VVARVWLIIGKVFGTFSALFFLLIIFTLVASGLEQNNNFSKGFKNIHLPLLYYALNAIVVYFIWFYR
jgi:hypothetical protein